LLLSRKEPEPAECTLAADTALECYKNIMNPGTPFFIQTRQDDTEGYKWIALTPEFTSSNTKCTPL
jgi:hypothetical protein